MHFLSLNYLLFVAISEREFFCFTMALIKGNFQEKENDKTKISLFPII